MVNLSDGFGVVALILEVFRERQNIRINIAEMRLHITDADAIRAPPRHQRSAAWTAPKCPGPWLGCG